MKQDELMRIIAPLAGADCDWPALRCTLFTVLDRLPIGIYIKDAATLRFVFRNRLHEQLFGPGRGDGSGLSVHDLFPPEMAQRFEAADREVLARGRLEMPDQHVECRDGVERILRSLKFVVGDDAGRPRLIVGMFEDVTAVRRAEVELRTANADLEQRVRARSEELERAGRINQLGEMAAGLAHEINQPLAAIIYTLTGAANRARGGALNNAQMLEAVQAAIAQAHRSAAIITRVRDMANRHAPRHQPLRLDAVAGDAVGLCAPAARARDVRLRLEVAARLPEVLADRIQIEQVLLNLIRNAIDAVVEEDGLWREVAVTIAPVDAGSVEACIEDSGTGRAPEELRRIFEPFFTTKPDGMGLGLAICQRIIEDHGGRLWAANRIEGGLCVRFTLPVGKGLPL